MITREFLYAGKAHFTVTNNKGEHVTFMVQASKPTAQFPRVSYFVKVFTGTDNTANTHYTYMGVLALDGTFRRSDRSRIAEGDVRARVFEFALDIIAGLRPLPVGYDVKHEGRCGRCARLLTNPESIDRGIGPECIKFMGGAVPRNRMAQAREAVRLERAAGVTRRVQGDLLSPVMVN
jgi:hypothetical protein